MKCIALIFFFIVTSFDITYASFPIQSHSLIYTDTIVSDKIEKYHSTLLKMGVDINSCRCESCRKHLQINDAKVVKSNSASSFYKTAIVLFVSSLIAFCFWILDGVACINDTSTCGNNPVPLSLAISFVLFYLSLFYFIKGLSKEKNDNL